MGRRDFSVYESNENSSNAETNEVDSSPQTNSAENEDSQTPISEEETDTLLKDKLKDDDNLPFCYPGHPHYLVPWSVQCEGNPNLPEILRRNREEAERNRKEQEAERNRKAREEAERNRKEEHEEVETFRKDAGTEENPYPLCDKETGKLLKDQLKDDESLPTRYPGLPDYLVPWSVQCEGNPNLPEILRKNREEAKRKRKEREETERNRRKIEAARNKLKSNATRLPPRLLMKASIVSNPGVGQVRARVSPKTVRFVNQMSHIESSNILDYTLRIYIFLVVACIAIILLLLTLVVMLALNVWPFD